MPKITEKLKAEERNERTVRLWPDGYGYKALERSAYLFVTQVRNYQASRRYVEAVGQDVVSIKFPKSVIDSLEVSAKNEDDGSVTLRMETAIDEQQYLLWRDGLPMVTLPKRTKDFTVAMPGPHVAEPVVEQQSVTVEPAVEPQPVVEGPAVEMLVAARIRSLNLAAKTPMQCMLLLSEFQAMLNSGDGE